MELILCCWRRFYDGIQLHICTEGVVNFIALVHGDAKSFYANLGSRPHENKFQEPVCLSENSPPV